MKEGTICKNCAWAKWETTPSGRIRRDVCGHCTFELKDSDLPKVPPHWTFFREASNCNARARTYGIWPDHMPDCPCFKPKD